MKTANEFIARFLTNLEERQSDSGRGACSGRFRAPISDVLPAQVRVMANIGKEMCPNGRCSDVDRAIIGASLGG
jgi:hypothetical protein